MSLSNANNRNDYTASGSASVYSFTFKIFTNEDLRVTKRSTSNVETLLVLDTDYTVSGAGEASGGTITLLAGNLTAGYHLTIRRVRELIQETDVRNQGPFLPEMHEDKFDDLTFLHQQQQDDINRSARLQETMPSSSFDTKLPFDIATASARVLATKSDGTGFEMGPTTGAISGAAASAAAAAASAAAALASQTAAASSASAAATSETNADASADAALISENNAETAETNAETAETNAAASQVAAATSASSASTSAATATTQASNAATSASAASTSASAASTSASSASTSATTATTQASNASTSATNAAASAAAAALSASSSIWRDVVFLTFADSPKTIVTGDRGKLFAVDTSGGVVVVNLPQISGLDLSSPFTIGFKKTTSDSNAITINRAGTDTIDGATSKSIAVAQAGSVFVPDIDTSPDIWTTADFGAQAGNLTSDIFSGTGSQTAFTLSVTPGSENNTFVFISGVYQQKDTYSVSGTTLTFSEAPPLGTDNINIMTGTLLTIGTPSDATVTLAKLAFTVDQLLPTQSGAAGKALISDGTNATFGFQNIMQQTRASTVSYLTGTTQIPFDDTIPQNTEGTEFLTCAITPKSATSKLVIHAVFNIASDAQVNTTMALFQDSTADATSGVFKLIPASASEQLSLLFSMTSGTTSSTTFKIRVGGGGASTIQINGVSGGRFLGGVAVSSITVTEYLT